MHCIIHPCSPPMQFWLHSSPLHVRLHVWALQCCLQLKAWHRISHWLCTPPLHACSSESEFNEWLLFKIHSRASHVWWQVWPVHSIWHTRTPLLQNCLHTPLVQWRKHVRELHFWLQLSTLQFSLQVLLPTLQFCSQAVLWSLHSSVHGSFSPLQTSSTNPKPE